MSTPDTDCSDDLNDIIDTPIPPDPPLPPAPLVEGNFMDTDKVLILNRIDTTQGKFHRNLIDLDVTDSLGSSDFLSVDAAGEGTRLILGYLIYYAFNARSGSFPSGGSNRTVRLDWKSSTGSTISGVNKAKTAGTIGRANDTKNAEITVIFRPRNFLTGTFSHFHAWIKPRGSDHTESLESCLQVGARHPCTQRGRHSELYSVEYTHPLYDYEDVTFVSPYSSNNFPLIQANAWFGMKFIIYNVNNNQAVHSEMWIDDNPIASDNSGFNNNWKKLWVYEHTGSKIPTWGGPNCQFRINMAADLDIIAYNIHEIIPPTVNSYTASAEILAEKAEFEESTGLHHPDYIEQMVPAFTPGVDGTILAASNIETDIQTR